MRSALPLILMSAVLGGCSLLPDSSGDEQRERGPSSVPPPQTAEGAQCLSELGRSKATFTPLPDEYTGPGCSRINTVQLSSLSGDSARIALSSIGAVYCPTASALSGWARFGVDRAARQILGSGLAKIETFGSYSCRNVAGSSRRSAHSRAQAVDVSAFVLQDGRRISLSGDWDGGSKAEQEFLRTIRQSACKRFGTVLSPDYNAAHEDHLHLETGSQRFCR